MKKIKAILCILLSLAMVFSLIACAKEKAPDDSPGTSPDSSQSEAPGASQSADPGASQSADPGSSGREIPNSITIGVTSYLGRFLPGMTPPANESACTVVYDVVFLTDPITKEYTSNILEDWYYEDDLTFIMKLKPGIYFNNGEEATAEDLLFSYNSFADRGAITASSLGKIIPEECKVLDKYTMQWKFSEPYGSFQRVVTYLFNKKWSESVGWDSDQWYNPVASGPYAIAEYVADDHMTLRLRDDYWDKDVEFGVDEWIIKYYPDVSTMYMELELGNISMCEVSTNDYSRYVKEGGADNVVCRIVDLGVVEIFCMGQEDNPVWKDKAVRQAVAYGVDWSQMGIASRGDLYIPQNSFIPKESPYYVDVGTYEFNPEKAKQILADAGYKDGDIVLKLYLEESARYKDMSEVFQYYCQQLGITVNIEYGDRASYLAAVIIPGENHAGFVAHAAGSIARDPSVVLGLLMIHNFNFCYVGDEKWQEMAYSVVYNSSFESRKEIYAEMAQYTFDEVLMIPYCESVAAIGYRSDVFTEAQIDQVVYTNSFCWLSKLSQTSLWN